MRRFVAALVVGLIVATGAQAQDYPNRPVRLIVPFAPGGPSDISARLLANGLQENFGRVVVENRPGAGASAGAQALIGAPPDGYTIMMASNVIASGKWLYASLPYDSLTDFRAVAGVSRSPIVMLVPGTSPARSVADFIRLAKEKPGGMNYASAGTGTIPQLATEFFLQKTGLKMTHIPYRGSGLALPALRSGEVDVYFDIALSAQSGAGEGLRVLGVIGPTRLEQLPNVPTLGEQGIDGVDVASWFGIVTRPGVPDAVVNQLNAAINKVQATEQFKEKIGTLGGVPLTGSPEDFRRLYTEELAMWGRVIPALGMKLD